MSVLWLPVILPIFVASVGYFLPRRAYRFVLLVAQLVQVALVTVLFMRVRSGGTLTFVLGDWPAGVGISLSADMLSSTLVALTGWFFLLMLLYNSRKLYMDRLFQFLFVILQALMIGLFLSGDLFNVYVLLELSTLVVSVLIMFKRNKQTLYDGMLYLMLNLASMSFMLLGIGFVYRALGTLDLAELAVRVAATTNPQALILPFSLVVTGIAMKSALFLLFAWLPSAHGAPSAPSIVSAILSGIQVKAGVYLLARWIGVFHGPLEVAPFFLIIGFLTAIAGFLLAMSQSTLKLVLAYSTISQVGLIVVGLTSGIEGAYWGGVFHIVNHALAKALLFLCAGVVIHAYGTKEIAKIRGVIRRMPAIGIAMACGILAIIGTPLFNGSISKYLIQGPMAPDPIYIAILVINLGTTVTFFKFGRILFSAPSGNGDEAAEPQAEGGGDTATRQPDPFTATVTVLLGLSCLVAGIWAEPLVRLLFGVEISVGGALTASKFLVFVLTVVVGLLLAYLLRKARALEGGVQSLRPYFTNLIFGVAFFFAATLGYLFVTTT